MSAGHSRTLMASGGDEPVADNGGGGHSVFAAALLNGLERMERQRFTAGELFSNYVIESVAGRAEQTPVYDPLRNSGHESGDFVFVRVKTPDGKSVEVTVKTPSAPAVDPAAFELSYWNSIQNSTDPDDFKDYLTKYPNGQFSSLAKRRVAALTDNVTRKESGGSTSLSTDTTKDSSRETPSVINSEVSGSAIRYRWDSTLYRSEDGGKTWERISPRLVVDNSPDAVITAVTEDPSDAKTIYTGSSDGSVHVTHNLGRMWTTIMSKAGGQIDFIFVSRTAKPRAIFLVVNDMKNVNKNSFILRSTDQGRYWEKVFLLMDIHIYSLREETGNRGGLIVKTNRGEHLSSDGGDNWHLVPSSSTPARHL